MAREKAVSLSPPPSFTKFMPPAWTSWINELFDRVGGGPFKIKGYSKTGLPIASEWANSSSTNPFTSLIWVYDEVGGATLAYSNGTVWKRVHDNTTVS
jgi:hypothetical protein